MCRYKTKRGENSMLSACKQWILPAIGVLWIGLLVLAERSFEGQYLWLSPGVVELGILAPNSCANVRVFIVNPTGQRITLQPAAGCGCTVTNIWKKVLLPVDATIVDVQVETASRTGRQRRQLDLICRAGNGSWREHIEIRYTVRRDEKWETFSRSWLCAPVSP